MFIFITHKQGTKAVNDRIFKDIDNRPMHLAGYFTQEVVNKYQNLARPAYKDFPLDLFSGSKSSIVMKRFINLTEVVSNFAL